MAHCLKTEKNYCNKNMTNHNNIQDIPLSGFQLIEASAGTGKTYNITELFLRLILEKELTVNQILVVTYTEAATEELRDRIRTRLRDKKTEEGKKEGSPETKKNISLLQQSLINFDEASIFTIHGFCFRVLKEQAYESSSLFDTELLTNQDHLVQETIDDFWRMNFYNTSPVFTEYALNNGYSSENLKNRVSAHLQNPLLKIIPKITKPETQALERDFNQAYTAATDCWHKNREEIKNLLTTTDTLKLSIYKKESLLKWIVEIHTFFSGKASSVLFPEKLIKLTPSELEKGKKKDHDPPKHLFFELCETLRDSRDVLVSSFKKKLLALETDLFSYARDALEQKKTHHNVLYFDDLLLKVHRSLYLPNNNRFAESLRNKYKAVLIDEFQDTDPVQYGIFSKLFIHKDICLFLIGDPKQAIYSFRNADLFAYLKAASEAQKPLALDKNWRSDPGLIRAVNSLFSSHKSPFLYRDIEFNPVKPASEKKNSLKVNNKTEPSLQLWFFPTDKEPGSESKINKPEILQKISDAVAKEISRLLMLAEDSKALINDKPVNPKDIAVLVRKHKQARLIQESLRQYSIPTVLHSIGNIFETEEADQLVFILEAIANPGDERKIKAALSTYILGEKGTALLRTDTNTAFLEKEMSLFQDYHDLWISSGFFQMFQQLLIDKEVRTRLISLDNGERKLTNILHLSEIIHSQLTQENLGITAALKWFSEQKKDNVHKPEEDQLRLETDRTAVKIVTIHKSKGLEYPIVFCPFLWEGQTENKKRSTALFHNKNRELTLDLGSDELAEHLKSEAEETISEDMRLLYVTLTRAKNCCYLMWGGFKNAGTSPLAYLFHNQKSSEPEDAVKTTKDIFKSLGSDDIFNTLKACENLTNSSIAVSTIPFKDKNQPVFSLSEQKADLSCRDFDKPVKRELRFTSFSSIISGRHHESDLPEADEFSHDTRDENIKEDLSIFNFPAGAVPGTMLHEVLENLDFTASDEPDIDQLIRDKFIHYGFEEKWIPCVRKMIKNLLSSALDPEDKDLCLAQINNADRLNELGFYFPIKNLSKQTLGSLFSKTGQTHALVGFAGEIEKLNFSPLNGFIKGFIDLIFRYKGKFYIVDWKSNLIGKDINQYRTENLIPIMQNDYYVLQYHLYTLALHKYLKNRLPNYDYEKDFGGVFYIFLRGINKTKGPDYGIYRDRPQKKLILEMERELTGQ
jgi:exodeoxyribonuclease V beta subunit